MKGINPKISLPKVNDMLGISKHQGLVLFHGSYVAAALWVVGDAVLPTCQELQGLCQLDLTLCTAL